VRIAFVSQPGHTVQPAVGSLELWSWQVAQRLAPDHDVVVYASRPPDGHEADPVVAGVRYRFVDHSVDRRLSAVLRRVWRVFPPTRGFFASAFYPLTYWVRVGLDLRRSGADVAHVFNYTQAVPILRRLAPDVKLVLHMQCEWLTQLDWRMLERRLRHADRILACSTALTEGAQARFPMHSSKFYTVFNGVDAGALANVDRRRGETSSRVLYVGRVSPEKGLHVLADALGLLVERGRDLTLTIVGEESLIPFEMAVAIADNDLVRNLGEFYRGSYTETVQSRLPPAAQGRLRFVGPVPYALLPEFYRDADLFVLPSVLEAFGMPLAEALAAGVPAVASRTGGIVDIVEDGVTGLLVEPGDSLALARAIERLLDDGDLRSRVAEAGRVKAAASFDWAVVAACLEAQLWAATGRAAPVDSRGIECASA
jgi:glycosyltransferase involved in cell wall biosynthesis